MARLVSLDINNPRVFPEVCFLGHGSRSVSSPTEMALYEHLDNCPRRLVIYEGEDPNVARCHFCQQYFCCMCHSNAHFPASCAEMFNWKTRVDLGREHFQLYNVCLDSWNYADSLDLLLKEKKDSFEMNFMSDHILLRSVFDELRRMLHLLRWASVLFWHYPSHYNLLNDSLLSLANAFNALLAAVPAQSTLEYWGTTYPLINEQRTAASDAAIFVLSTIRLLRISQGYLSLDASVGQEISRWRTRPSRM